MNSNSFSSGQPFFSTFNTSRGSADSQAPRRERNQQPLRYRTIEHAPSSPQGPGIPSQSTPQIQRPRYTAKERFAPIKEHDPPDILLQYRWKPWGTKPPDIPDAPPTATANSSKKPQLRDPIHGSTKKELVKALGFEHPMVNLDIGTLSAMAKDARPEDKIGSSQVVAVIRGAVRQASAVKRQCQELVGLYLERVFTEGMLHTKADRPLLDELCPRLAKIADSDDSNEQDDGDDSKQTFWSSLLGYIYSGRTLSSRSKAYQFVQRLLQLGLLPRHDFAREREAYGTIEYPPTLLVRSVATQLAAEFKRHYKEGWKVLVPKVHVMESVHLHWFL